MKQIVVKLPNGNWIRIKSRLSGLSTGRSSKKTTYTLLAESIDKPEIPHSKPVRIFYISSTRVTKYINKLLDHSDARGEDSFYIVVEYYKPELYKVIVYSDSRDIAYSIALEMDIVKKE